MIVGIDLGTTNSAVAYWRDGEAILAPNALGDLLTPSAVSVTPDGGILTGLAARERAATHPRESALAFKRYMGTQQTTRLGKQTFTAEDLSSLILRNLKADAEAAAGEAVTGAVITVPAYFNDRQRKATRRAGELAGLEVKRLINEPTAAALAFGIQNKEEKEPFLVFDLGGGTFDVSIVEVFDGIVEVRATAGDNRLGGEDFNDALATLARSLLTVAPAQAGAPAQVSPNSPGGPGLRRGDEISDSVWLDHAGLVREAAERARRGLTEGDPARFSLVIGETEYAADIHAAAFEEQVAGLIARLREPVLRSLRDSNIRAQDLSEIVLVGGATRMPVVRRAITRMFGRFPDTTVHPDHAVALGAAVQAGLLAKDAALDEVRLTDVCPFTLGVDHAEPDGRGGWRAGLFSPIIDRNTPLPASRVNVYSTLQDNQRLLQFGIYQGEAREVAANVKLGELKVPVPARPAGQAWAECRFSYDASGLLEVDVHVPDTGQKKSLTIIDDADAASPAELAKRRDALARLKFHPREDAANAALLARAARAFESFTGERRYAIGAWISNFEAALESQKPREITEARDALVSNLDQIEGDRYL